MQKKNFEPPQHVKIEPKNSDSRAGIGLLVGAELAACPTSLKLPLVAAVLVVIEVNRQPPFDFRGTLINYGFLPGHGLWTPLL